MKAVADLDSHLKALSCSAFGAVHEAVTRNPG
jgi:hypothetical protein